MKATFKVLKVLGAATLLAFVVGCGGADEAGDNSPGEGAVVGIEDEPVCPEGQEFVGLKPDGSAKCQAF